MDAYTENSLFTTGKDGGGSVKLFNQRSWESLLGYMESRSRASHALSEDFK